MRLVTWNCRMAVHRKMDALLSLRPDVVVLQECAHPDVEAAKAAYARATDVLWAGENRTKGMAVLSFGSARLSKVQTEDEKLTIATRVTGLERDFNLLGKWAWAEPSSYSAYVRDVQDAVDRHESFLRDGPSVLAGDLNSSAFFDKETRGGHTELVARLSKLGLKSAYHSLSDKEHGDEARWTYFKKNPDGAFHLDYVFLPSSWLGQAKVEVPDPDRWLELSDHMPVIVDLF